MVFSLAFPGTKQAVLTAAKQRPHLVRVGGLTTDALAAGRANATSGPRNENMGEVQLIQL